MTTTRDNDTRRSNDRIDHQTEQPSKNYKNTTKQTDRKQNKQRTYKHQIEKQHKI